MSHVWPIGNAGERPIIVDDEWAQRIILGGSHALAAYIELLQGRVVARGRSRRRREQMVAIDDRRVTLITLRSQLKYWEKGRKLT